VLDLLGAAELASPESMARLAGLGGEAG
jgi:hypothetical protein